MKQLIFLILLIGMWMYESPHRKFHQSPLNWKVRSTKGHYPVQHKDTTYTHKEVKHIDPILNKKL